jgi:hypothetical protein
MSDSLKAREARLRRAAARQGLAIVKSRRRGAKAYAIVDPETEAIIRDGASDDDALTIEQAEAVLGNPQNTKSISVANLNAANDE